MGIIGRRRVVGHDAREPEVLTPAPAPSALPSGPRGTAVPLVPQPAMRPALSDVMRQPGVALPTVPQVGPAQLARFRTSAPAEVVPTTPTLPSPLPSAVQAAAGEADNRFGLDERRFPILTQIGKNLTLAAARGELDPVVGRDSEIEQALDVLAKRQGNNPCLVGAAGVGKTSVARGIAESIAARRDVASLDDRILIEIR